MISLTKFEILVAVIVFLEHHFKLTKPDDTGILFKSLLRLIDNKIAEIDDKHIWKDWNESFNLYNKKNIFTEKEALDIMINFLEKYFNRTGSNDIRSVLSDLLYSDYGEMADSGAWDNWQDALAKSKNYKVIAYNHRL